MHDGWRCHQGEKVCFFIFLIAIQMNFEPNYNRQAFIVFHKYDMKLWGRIWRLLISVVALEP